MSFEEGINPVFVGPLVVWVKVLCSDSDSPFTERMASCPKVCNPFDKKVLLRRREELLRCVSFLGRLVDVEKASPKSRIRNVEITSCLFDIDLNAIAFLADKAAAALFEQLLSLMPRAL
jgi:hypothetical protein